MNIRKIFREGKKAFMTALLLSGMLSLNAFAAEGYYVDAAPIVFSVGNHKDAPKEEAFTVVFESVTVDAPLPSETTKEISVKPGEVVESNFGTIHFTRPGTYEYVLYEKEGTTANMTYDKNRYHVTVLVTNVSENPSDGLVASFVGANIEDSAKEADPPFINNIYTKSNNGGNNGGKNGGNNGGSTDWHSVDPNPSSPSVEGESRNPVVDVISQIPDVLGATRNAVKTGDESAMAVYAAIFGVSIIGLGVWAVTSRKKKSA